MERNGEDRPIAAWREAANYDDVADTYGDEFIDEVGERLVTLLDPQPGERVLDAGAGRGAVTRALVTQGAEVWAIDISERMVEQLRLTIPAARLSVEDAAHTGHSSGSFDSVTAGYLITVTPGLVTTMLKEWRRVLRPGGKLAVSEPGPIHADWFWLHELAGHYFPRPTPWQHNENQEREISQLLDFAAVLGFGLRASTTASSPVVFDDAESAGRFISDAGVGAALRLLSVPLRAAFTASLEDGLTRMLNANGRIIVDRTARLFVFDT